MESSSAARLAKHYSGFVHKYAPELRAEFDAAREFKNKTRRCSGEVGSVEASMLYVMIREFRPRRVLEVGALCGSSTRWLLAALSRRTVAAGYLQRSTCRRTRRDSSPRNFRVIGRSASRTS